MDTVLKYGPYVLIAFLAFIAYGSILWSGAGFSHPDDTAASVTQCCEQRPILAATYALNQWARGGWMPVNLILHMAAGMLLFRVSGSLLAALLFVCHPFAADSVASVAGRSALLSAVFVLVFILTVRNSKHWKTVTVVAAVLVALTLGFSPTMMMAIKDTPAFVTHAVNYTSAVGSYVLPAVFVPYGLSADPDIQRSAHGLTWFVVAVYIAWWAFLLRPGLRGPLALLLLPLVPYWFVALPDVFFEHRGYLAAAGACWMISRIHWASHPPVALVALPVFLLLAQQRADVYSSPLTLWQDAAAKAPDKARPHMNYGVALAGKGRFEEAKVEWERTLSIDPSIDSAWGNLARLAVHRRDFSEASRILDAHREVVRVEETR